MKTRKRTVSGATEQLISYPHHPVSPVINLLCRIYLPSLYILENGSVFSPFLDHM